MQTLVGTKWGFHGRVTAERARAPHRVREVRGA